MRLSQFYGTLLDQIFVGLEYISIGYSRMVLIGLDKLCPPAAAYFGLSAVAMIVMLWQNLGNNKVYCLGVYKCDVESTAIIFGVKAVYVVFWTWILNILCKNGFSGVAWFLVIIPFLLFFISLSWLMISS